jgi:formylglycine-generating enzyme required for sulfatase activity
MRTKLHALLAGLILGAGLYPALAQPALGIVQTNNQSLLYWPANATGFVLQSTTNLASPNWTLATDATPATYGSQTAVIVTNSPASRFFRLLFQNNFTADGMALIPAGSFTIGDTLDGITSAIPTNVTVSAFYMDINLVSYVLWQTNYNYAISHGYGFDAAGSGKGTNYPVDYVSWYDVVKWSNARSQQAGLAPVYYTDANFTQIYTNGNIDAVYPNWAANGYRLPTTAEWEKAARGGLNGQRFPWGNTISENLANYNGDSNNSYDLGPYYGSNTNFNYTGYPYTSPVGYFAANGYGLYDMAGNLEEWCWDWYAAPAYPSGSAYLGGTDPHGPATGSARMLRGGSWSSDSAYARCAYPDGVDPSIGNGSWGFRCVRNVPNPTTPDGMALIPAGSFTIGDTLDGNADAIPTNVTVSAFYMDTNLVTYAQWQTNYSYAISHSYVFDNAGNSKAANHPAAYMNWYDSVKWSNARSQQAGLTPDKGSVLALIHGRFSPDKTAG